MRKMPLAVLALMLAVACIRLPGRGIVTGTSQSDSEAQEYAVYSALIKARYIGDATQLIVLNDQTGLGPDDDLDKTLDYAKQNLPDIPDKVIADFKAKNRQSYPLKPRFNLPVRYVFVTDQQLQEMFQDYDGWDKFYEQYPGSQGTMTLSRVGFNARMDRALVYVGNQADGKAGSGHMVLLVKENGAWKIQKEVMIWIS